MLNFYFRYYFMSLKTPIVRVILSFQLHNFLARDDAVTLQSQMLAFRK